MNKTFIIAGWEYFEKVRTKTFIISLILTPLIILLFTTGPALLMDKENSTKPIGFVDTSGVYFKEFNEVISSYKIKENIPAYILINLSPGKADINEIMRNADHKVLNQTLAGYLVVLNGGSDSVTLKFRSGVIFSPDEINRFGRAFQHTRLLSTLKEKFTDKELELLSRETVIAAETINRNGIINENDFMTTFFSSLVMIMLLLMIIISIGGMLIRSILEEKSNRLIEILLSSCTPEQLLSGKILGLSALGLTQILVWSFAGLLFAGTSLLPPGIFSNFLPMLLFFVLGFFFYTSVYVGIGSIVTTEQEAQQLNSYLSILLFIPIIFALPAIQNPDSTLVKILSFIPFTSPTIMLLRLNTTSISILEIALITAVMIVTIMLTIMITSKIFKIGILSYGKRPGIKEITEWLKD